MTSHAGLNLRIKSELGQFMTPPEIARFMVSMFPDRNLEVCNLLDAGAGLGSLSSAFADRFIDGRFSFREVNIHAYEVHRALCAQLRYNFDGYRQINVNIINKDFIESAVVDILRGERPFSHAILNPPYKKINSNSVHRQLIRRVGIETVNLYSAFVALVVEMMKPGGIVVAIIPRSFCNGLYYKPFRQFIMKRAAIRRIHLFGARDRIFKDDDVLQENIIIMLERDAEQSSVTVSTSTDSTFADLASSEYPFSNIVPPYFDDAFLFIPTKENEVFKSLDIADCSLESLGLSISTGPVVDFRLKEFLRDMPSEDTVPLLYPAHFSETGLNWPLLNSKKSNAIVRNEYTKKWLYPIGSYCIVKRFSSKEEKKRIVAYVLEGDLLAQYEMIGLENHLNIFHINKNGIPLEVAYGLASFLNSTAVDNFFRRFSGHTQVNATDLRQMKYPSVNVLANLGKWAIQEREYSQTAIDEKIERLIA